LAVLDEAGIGHCGGGRTAEEARRPVVIERKGVRFAFLACTSVFWPVGHAAGHDTPGVSTIKAHTAYQPNARIAEMPGGAPTVVTWPDAGQLAAMREDVRRIRERAHIVVLSCHWGVSGSSQTCEYQRAIGRAAIDAGADLVIGHGPHVLQGIETFEGPNGARPVFYSLANFVFDWSAMRGKSLDGLLVRCTVHRGRPAAVAFIPVQRTAANDPAPLDATVGEGRRIVGEVECLSAGYGTRFRIDAGEVLVEGIG
ncbi:MAG: CapA family protein, partial [Chloroflexota bacterium]